MSETEKRKNKKQKTFFVLILFLSIFFSLFLLTYGASVYADGSNVTVTVDFFECNDSIDNDGDSLVDYPNDPGCESADDDDETDATPPVFCGDGTCNGSENCSTCSADCGNCPSGGGGGGAPIVKTQATFKGNAYPGSKVTLLKDALVAAQVPAGPDAAFEISLSGLSSGTYTFGVWAEDNGGRRSITHTFTIQITYGATTIVSGIFLPPTIASDKIEVRRGENIVFFGQTIPTSEVVILVNSDDEFFKTVQSDIDGIYLHNFDTSPLEFGSHFAKSKVSDTDTGIISSFGKAAGFKVGTRNVLAGDPVVCPAKADLNDDCRVNLVDFSIAAYWWQRIIIDPEFLVKEAIELNGDEKVDLVDFSIMAYYWTG